MELIGSILKNIHTIELKIGNIFLSFMGKILKSPYIIDLVSIEIVIK